MKETVSREVVMVTGNQNKMREFERMMGDSIPVKFVNYNLEEIQSSDIVKICEHKAREAHKILSNMEKDTNEERKRLIITEDVGLYINCLNSFPGPNIKWMLKALGSKGLYDLVSKYEDHSCVARCVYVIFDGVNGIVFEGCVEGDIVEPRGRTDFGWDCIFQANGEKKTFGEMSVEEKGKISHRAKAFKRLKEYLLKNP